MPTITAITTEVQTRCNALTNGSSITAVLDCVIAAKKVEAAGGTLSRTVLDAQIQRVNDLSGSGSLIEDLIALAAMQVPAVSTSKKLKVQEFLTSGNWTRPSGVDAVEVLLVGGGGGAGGTDSTGVGGTVYLCSGAGGGGQVLKQIVDVTSITVGATASVLIGAGGSGGSGGGVGGAGGVGGDTSFGSLLTALGGGSGSGYKYSGGGGSGTARATTGGGSGATGHESYGVAILPGLGGGAGSSARNGAIAYLNNTIGSSYIYLQSRNYGSNTVPCGRGSGQVSSSTGSSTYSVNITTDHVPGEHLYGYGAGGGSIGSYGACNSMYGAGGGNVANAIANTGGGGAANVTSSSSVGGVGGSGRAIITWWE